MKLDFPNQEQKLRALRIQIIETNDGIILKRGRMEIKIGGERAAEVMLTVLTATAVDGATRDEIRELFAAPDRPAVDYLVQQLENRHILVPADTLESIASVIESSLEVFYWHFGELPQQISSRLNDQQIAIVGVNHISRQLATALASSGMENFEVVNYPLLCNLRLFDDHGELSADQWPASLKPPTDYKQWAERLNPEAVGCIVATSDFGGLQLMRRWNEFCVKYKCHFLPVVLQDLIGYIGPLFVPDETACFECLRARENSHMEDPSTKRAAEASAFEGQAVAGFHPSMASVLGDIAAIELSKFYGGWMPSRSVGMLIEVNLLAMQLTSRKVLKIPRCSVCSTLNIRAATSPNKNVFIPGYEVHT